MKRLFLTCFFIALLTVNAFQMKRESYIDIPTADFTQGFYINVNSSYPIKDVNDVKFDPNIGIDFTYDRFGGALKWYNGAAIAVDLSYQILARKGSDPGFAVGISEIAVKKFISTAGFDEAFNDDEYTGRAPESWSFYMVANKKLNSLIELNAGLGRGKFVGYGPFGKYMNTDILNEENHEIWAFGLFGGMKFTFSDNLAFITEADGRDFNIGMEYKNGPLKGILTLSKLEVIGDSENDFSPRIGLNISYGTPEIRKKKQKEKINHPETLELIDSISINTYKLDKIKQNKIEKTEEKEPIRDSVKTKDNFEEIKREIEETNIKFAYAKAELDTETRSFLDRAAELIKDEDVHLLITGHTCSIGTLEFNQKLSKRRAESVKKYLTEKGIPSKKISIEALGERRPIADNNTEEGRIKNRRAELILLPRRD